MIRFLLILLLFSFEAKARPIVEVNNTTSLEIENLQVIADNFDIPLWALLGILATEKGKNGQAIQNSNLTWDLGAFQINTIHLNELKALGLEANTILENANINACVAGWILSRHLAKTKDTWEAIGNYHSKTPKLKINYINKVAENVLYLQNNQHAIENLLLEVNNGK